MTAAPPGAIRSLEQPQLGGEIGLDASDDSPDGRAMRLVKAAGRDAHAVEAVLVEPVRGRLDRKMRDAFAGERVERAMQRDRIGRRQRAVDLAAAARRGRWCRCSRPRCPSAAQIWRVKAATEVLPLVPVTAAMVCGWRGKNRAAASASARRALPTRTKATPCRQTSPARRSAMIAAAPAASACGDEAQPVGLARRQRDEQIARLDRAAVGRQCRRRRASAKRGVDSRRLPVQRVSRSFIVAARSHKSAGVDSAACRAYLLAFIEARIS